MTWTDGVSASSLSPQIPYVLWAQISQCPFSRPGPGPTLSILVLISIKEAIDPVLTYHSAHATLINSVVQGSHMGQKQANFHCYK